MFVGFFSGIMYDLFFSGLFGFSVLVFVYVGYYSGMFSEVLGEEGLTFVGLHNFFAVCNGAQWMPELPETRIHCREAPD